jgi:hypothetical protein
MKIKNHDDFPKLDHRTAPSFRTERDWVIDSPPIPRARPGDGRHDQLGNFQTALLGRITPASTQPTRHSFAVREGHSAAAKFDQPRRLSCDVELGLFAVVLIAFCSSTVWRRELAR